MKIWFQKHIVKGRMPWLDQAYETHMQRVVSAGTTVDFHSLPASTYASDLPADLVRHGSVEDLFAGYFVAQALEAQRQGYDAYIVGTLPEPALLTIRALVDIPVLGYSEVAIHTGLMHGHRLGIVGFIPELADRVQDNLRRYGIANDRVTFGVIPGGQDAIQAAFAGQPGRLIDGFKFSAQELIADGADVLLPGEAVINEVLFAHDINRIDGAPVIDSDGLVVKMAELFVQLRQMGIVGKSDCGYWQSRPSAEVIRALTDRFSPSLDGEES